MPNILIVEDDKLLANAYRIKFKDSSYEAKVAGNGKVAIETIEGGFMPDVIILDLIMPVKDGFSTLQELKASDKYKNIPILIASNLGQEQDIKKCMDMGAKDFFVKSNVSLDELVENVKGYLKG